jgi:hypothetical protein
MRRLVIIVNVIVIAIGAMTGFACGSAPPHDGTPMNPGKICSVW